LERERKRTSKMNKALDKKSGRGIKQRTGLFFVFVVICLMVAFGKIVYLNVTKNEEYKKIVMSQRISDSTTIAYQRGYIYDSKGTILAASKKVYNVVLDAYVINQEEEKHPGTINATVNAVSECLGISKETVLDRIKNYGQSKYYIIAKEMSAEEKDKFDAKVAASKESKELVDIVGVWFEAYYVRYYPMGSLACDVIGYTNAGNAGAYGLEEFYNTTLNGTDGRVYEHYISDSNVEQNTISAVDGNSLVTTIDANIQRIVEEKLLEYNEKFKDNARDGNGAENAACIIMNPKKGEVYAMASYPNFDLNYPRRADLYFEEGSLKEETSSEVPSGEQTSTSETSTEEDERPTAAEALAELWKNYCISATYEPGSVAKPFTVAMGLDSGKMTGEETYFCGGLLEVGGYKIKCHNRYGDGEMTVGDAIAQSCNVSLMLMGETIGKTNFLKYFQDFNFGLKTNIDLTGEARTVSLVFNEQTMGPTELATSTFGQGYNVTMIQMISAFCSLVNGGYYYEPHMVSQILNAEGAVIENIQPRLLKQPISSSTSKQVIEYCNGVVTDGTGKKARPAGYMIGGKTGTAETIVDGKRGSKQYVVSFMGYAPADDPEIVIYVVLDRPNLQDQTLGTAEAAIITREILTEVLPYLNIPMTVELTEEEKQELLEKGLYDATLIQTEITQEELQQNTGDNKHLEGMQIDPATGYGIDPHTGEYLDPNTGYPIDPGSSFITTSD